MPAAREKVVREMMNEAYEALTRVTAEHEASAEEVISAIISMMKNTIVSTRDMGADMSQIRTQVEYILMECHNKSAKVA